MATGPLITRGWGYDPARTTTAGFGPAAALASIPSFTDFPEDVLVVAQPLRENFIQAIAGNSKFAVVRKEVIYCGFFKHGDTVPVPTSPVDGYTYTRAEITYRVMRYATRNPGSGFTSGMKAVPPNIGASQPGNLYWWTQDVSDVTGVVSLSTSYYISGGAETITTHGIVKVQAVCQRSSDNTRNGAAPSIVGAASTPPTPGASVAISGVIPSAFSGDDYYSRTYVDVISSKLSTDEATISDLHDAVFPYSYDISFYNYDTGALTGGTTWDNIHFAFGTLQGEFGNIAEAIGDVNDVLFGGLSFPGYWEFLGWNYATDSQDHGVDAFGIIVILGAISDEFGLVADEFAAVLSAISEIETDLGENASSISSLTSDVSDLTSDVSGILGAVYPYSYSIEEYDYSTNTPVFDYVAENIYELCIVLRGELAAIAEEFEDVLGFISTINTQLAPGYWRVKNYNYSTGVSSGATDCLTPYVAIFGEGAGGIADEFAAIAAETKSLSDRLTAGGL